MRCLRGHVHDILTSDETHPAASRVASRRQKKEQEERVCKALIAQFRARPGIGYTFYDSGPDGLDVVHAEEFPEVLLDLVEDLGDLSL